MKAFQDPAFVPPGGIANSQTNSQRPTPASLEVKLSSEPRLQAGRSRFGGIDNLNSWDLDDGSTTRPGLSLGYGNADPGKPVFGDDPSVPP